MRSTETSLLVPSETGSSPASCRFTSAAAPPVATTLTLASGRFLGAFSARNFHGSLPGLSIDTVTRADWPVFTAKSTASGLASISAGGVTVRVIWRLSVLPPEAALACTPAHRHERRANANQTNHQPQQHSWFHELAERILAHRQRLRIVWPASREDFRSDHPGAALLPSRPPVTSSGFRTGGPDATVSPDRSPAAGPPAGAAALPGCRG